MLPPDHGQRVALNDEVHARPPMPLAPPLRASYLALVTDGPPREAGWAAIRDLMARHGAPPPSPGANHHSADLGAFRIRWEAHSEFHRITVVAPGGRDPFSHPALGTLPEDWVAALPGRVLVAAHVAFLAERDVNLDPQDIARLFAGNPLVGSAIAGASATVFTDFRIHGDGFSRLLVLDRGMTATQAGRMIQRLLEVDTYRMLALLTLGVARELTPFLREREATLASLAHALVGAAETDEPDLLLRLTRMAAEIEGFAADNLYRFSAAVAYHDLVDRRIAELREQRIEGLQTFREFTERRLAPAMDFCRSTAARQASLAERVARTTQLLSTRVELTREQQAHALLASMNRRAQLQLKLQSTVEGLSVAAITYYVVNLVGDLARGLDATGVRINAEIAMAASVPVVAGLVALGLRETRKIAHHS